MTRRTFTLIEIMVCLFLLGTLASLAGFKIARFVQEQRFAHHVQEVYSALQSAQLVAMASNADIEIECRTLPSPSCRFSTVEPVIESIRSIIEFPESVYFTWNQSSFAEKKIQIYASGRVEPQGILGFHWKENKKQLWIDLQQPLLIKIFEEYPHN